MAKEELRSLRSTLETLKKESLVLETDREVDPKLEVAAIQKRLDGGPPMIFNKVKGSQIQDSRKHYSTHTAKNC
ncbi:MAG: UbiD family decarboxylase [Deltaproteobacteria bacterium]|nr:UbiD family decarboxylase [Deltaproteobacteria bacterium]